MSRGPRRSTWEIFRRPVLIAAVSFGGLLSALLGDGWADALSWVLLGGVLAIALFSFFKPRPER